MDATTFSPITDTSNRANTIGIIGGGQLARMSSQAAQRLGFQVAILDSDRLSPAAQVTQTRIAKDWNSASGTAELAGLCSIITLENEWVTPENLRRAETSGTAVYPGWRTMRVARDKFLQRERFSEFGLPTPRHAPLTTWADAHSAAEEWGLPLVLKSRHGGYDGYGVVIVRTEDDWDMLPVQDASRWFAEEYVPFDRELALMIARSPSGETAVYPVVESRQTADGHRCDTVIAPAPELSEATLQQARTIGIGAVEALGGVGLYGIELFLIGDKLTVNEIAPRPHNSGHYTMEGSSTSQFEQHIRSVTDLPLGPTALLAPVVIMANLLAPRNGGIDLQSSLAAALHSCSEVHIHWYGKSELRTGRKMGHMNLLGEDIGQTLSTLLAARSAFWRAS